MDRIKSELSTFWSNTCYTASDAWRYIRRADAQHGQPAKVPEGFRQWCLPVALSSLLFLSWGLAYGLLDIMNYHVRLAMGLERGQTALLAGSYYAAYLFGPLLIGGPAVKRIGYRFAMVVGLFILAIGDFFMSLGASKCSLAGMVVSHFVIGLGVSILERSANPYVVNCGPRTSAAFRILVAQSFAGIGTVLAPPIANAFVFDASSSDKPLTRDTLHPGRCLLPPSTTGSCDALSSVITFYRGIAYIVLAYTVVFAGIVYFTRAMPELPVPKSPLTTHKWYKLWEHPLVSVRHSRIWWGVFANFFNMGCQVTFAQFIIEHMKVNACRTEKWAANWMTVAQGLFVLGRVASAGLVSLPKVFKPRYVLLAFVAGAVAFSGASTAVSGSAAIGLGVMVMFWEAPSFPMIFESATAGYEEWTPTCETLMILSISGGALQPALVGKIADAVGISKGFILTTVCFGVVFTYPLFCNLIPSYRKALDAAESGEAEGKEDVAVEMEAGSTGTGVIQPPAAAVVPRRVTGYFGATETSTNWEREAFQDVWL